MTHGKFPNDGCEVFELVPGTNLLGGNLGPSAVNIALSVHSIVKLTNADDK